MPENPPTPNLPAISYLVLPSLGIYQWVTPNTGPDPDHSQSQMSSRIEITSCEENLYGTLLRYPGEHMTKL